MTETRRDFLKMSGGLLVLAARPLASGAARESGAESLPWYRTTFRWGQTNINEKDPIRYDIEWWREYWKRTGVQGLVINAGGIVAYYPSRFPLQYRARFLGDRDLFGELIRAAHEDGIAVLARMDSNRAHEEFYRAHPDWFAVDSRGRPYRAGDLYVSCIHSPYYDEYIPDVIREVASLYRPEGFTDNSWSGLDRNSICHCQYCRRSFQSRYGAPLPGAKDWEDPAYRDWIGWNYARRLEVWDRNNLAAREAGGKDCLWIGMIGGDMVSEGARFRDHQEICRRAELIMFDDQGRRDSFGFQGNGEMGKRMHGLLGWDKLIPESMATYQRSPTFRKAANTEAETRMWMVEGFAGTIQPWWHHVGAYQEDRRQFRIVEPIYRWYRKNQSYLVRRRPLAQVGVVWSQRNVDFLGRDRARELAVNPYDGMNQALIRARIPYLPVHADQIRNQSSELKLLILPNLGVMTEGQVESVREFSRRGGSLIATGDTSLFNEWGDRREDFALAELFGARATERVHGPSSESDTDHSYMRIVPAVGSDVDGPRSGDEPPTPQERHEILRGFEETNILPFGGRVREVIPESGTRIPLTLVPDFPVYPPETSWMRQPETRIPCAILTEHQSGSRVAFLPADVDRRFHMHNLPDHGDLLANIVFWGCRNEGLIELTGPGWIDCHLYRQESRLVAHFVNLTSAGTWRSPVHELIPVGPFRVRLKIPGFEAPRTLKLLVSKKDSEPFEVEDGRISFRIQSILDHEVIVLE